MTEMIMRKQRTVETAEERNQRLVREAQMKRNETAASEAAVDQMISRNIERFGP